MSAEARDLELLVAKIQQSLAPDAEVIHNAKIPGRKSKTARQIDVLMKQRVGQYEILIAIECKDYNRPIDVKSVEGFFGMLEDIRAHKGVLVCPRGFTAAAKILAESRQIDIYSPIDTDHHKWKVKVTMPAICDFREAALSFGIRSSTPYPLKLDCAIHSIISFDSNHVPLGATLDVASEKWNAGRYPVEVGIHNNLDIFDLPVTLIDNGCGKLIPVTLFLSIRVRRQLYFGYVDIPKISGFKDECSGKIITNAFQIGLLAPDEVDEQWTKIDKEQDAPVAPVISLQGLVCWDPEPCE